MSLRRALVLGSLGSVLLPLAYGKQGAIKVQIGAEDDWRPYAYTLSGKPMGFSVELVQAAWAAGVEVELVALPYARCMREVEAGKLPACFNTLRDARNEDKYLWHSTHLFRARIGIYGRADGSSEPLNLQSLKGKRIGVTNGYEYGSAFDDDPAMVRDVANSDLSSLRKLVAGRVDYALVYDRVANEIAVNNQALGQQFRLRGTLLDTGLYLSFSKRFEGAAALVKKFDAALETIRKNGEYARIEARWR